jgi:hypothetical protein
MLETASLIVINLVIAGIIGFILGYLVGKNNFPKITLNPIFRKNSNLDYKPLILTTPKPTGKDPLTKIKGINSKIEIDLNNLGIYHFEQISRWSNKNSEWIEEFLLLPGIARNNQWAEQAKILTLGKDTPYSLQVENGEVEVD